MSDAVELYDIPPVFQNRLLKWLEKTEGSIVISAEEGKFTVFSSRDQALHKHKSLERAINDATGSRAAVGHIDRRFQKRVLAWLEETRGAIRLSASHSGKFDLTLSSPIANIEVEDEDIEVALVLAEDELETQTRPIAPDEEPETEEAPTVAARTRRIVPEEEPETIAAPTRMAETRAAPTKLFGGDDGVTMPTRYAPNHERDYPESFAQGARCGHIEGKGRAGQYVIGEEIPLAEEATDAQGLSRGESRDWAAGYVHGYRLAAEGSPLDEELDLTFEENARWSRAYIDSLPDSAFLHVEPGGTKDRIGRSHPLSLRHFPYKNRSGRIDRSHLRAALSRAHQKKTDLPVRTKEQIFRRAQEIHRREFGAAESEYPSGVPLKKLGYGSTWMAENSPARRPPRGSHRQAPSVHRMIEIEEARERREQRPFDPEAPREHYAKTHHFAVNTHHEDKDVIREVMLGDTGYVLVMWDTRRTDSRGQSILGYAFYEPGEEEPLFEGEDFAGSPMHGDDSDESTRSLLGFLTMKPGDTDREYFARYNERQMDFARGAAEELSMWAMEPESDFDPPPLVDVR